MARLNDVLRDKLKDVLAEVRYSGMFGDGLEMEYIYEGTTIVGLNQMTDEELVEEYESVTDEEDEFLAQLKAELAIETMLEEKAV